MIREIWKAALRVALPAFAGALAVFVLASLAVFGLPGWWLIIKSNPQALGSFLGTVFGGLFVAVAAGIGFLGVRHATAADGRRHVEQEKRRASNLAAIFEADMRDHALRSGAAGLFIAARSDAALASFDLSSPQLHRARSRSVIFEKFADRLDTLPPDVLPYLLQVYERHAALVSGLNDAHAMGHGDDRGGMLIGLARGMVLHAHEMANVEIMLHDWRLGLPMPPMPAQDAQISAVEVQIKAARAKYAEVTAEKDA